ncbi:hypothetical protein ACHHYP_15872 [Achlya hypogyna]|uniref:Uncharacterized protein n=1 Tax=Achlya hypogyna TaxID=1202772 RepID=A0A1V9YA05_ACHHY|nr:hypothetical protein ACHHYP_15872 [Achlya hypogyna]
MASPVFTLDVHVQPADAVRGSRAARTLVILADGLLTLTPLPTKNAPAPPVVTAFDLADCTEVSTREATAIASSLAVLCFGPGVELLLDCHSVNMQMDLLEAVRPFVAPIVPPTGPTWQRWLAALAGVTSAPLPIAPSVSVADLQAHVRGMKRMYDLQRALTTPTELYAALLELEAKYVAEHFSLQAVSAPDNFCHTVYQLHPLAFACGTNPTRPGRAVLKTMVGVCPFCKTEVLDCQKEYMYLNGQEVRCEGCSELFDPQTYFKSAHGTTAFNTPLRSVLAACPRKTCKHPVAFDDQLKLHVLGQTVSCAKCKDAIAYETFQIALFVQEHPSFELATNKKNKAVTLRVLTPPVPADGTWASFTTAMQERIAAVADSACKDGVYFFRQLIYRAMLLVQRNALGAFPIDLVLAMYLQLDFVNKVCPNAEYWLDANVGNAALKRYAQFVATLRQHKRAGAMLVPTVDIDLVWHTHMTFPKEYVGFCKKNVGVVLDHDDTVAGGDLTDAFAATRDLWHTTTGKAYTPAATDAVSAADVRFAKALRHLPDDTRIVLAVVGTPVFDARTRLQGSPQEQLMQAAGVYKARPAAVGGTTIETGCATGGCGETGLMKLFGIKHKI